MAPTPHRQGWEFARRFGEIAYAVVAVPLEPRRLEFLQTWAGVGAVQDNEDLDSTPIRGFLKERIRRAKRAVSSTVGIDNVRLSSRLEQLTDLAAEDWPAVEIPSEESIRSLARMLSRLGDAAMPSVTLTNGGQLWAEWTSASGKVALIVGSEGAPAIAALLPDKGTIGRPSHLNFCGSEEEVTSRLLNDRELHSVLL